MAESWREWIPRFDAWAATYDEDTADPWFAYEAAWAFVARWLEAGLGDRGAADARAGRAGAPGSAAPGRGGLHGASVVDVGCGTGAFLRLLADLGARVTGVEPSSGMRDVAAARVPEAAILDGHLASIPLADGAVDALISTYTVSHLTPAEQPAALDEMLRVVAGRGPIVIVDVPVVPPDDLARVSDLLVANGRAGHVDWYAEGQGLDLPMWRHALEETGRRVHVELLGQLVTGLAAVDPGGEVAR
jgi:SAM-dependent methyltransferase